MQMGQTHYPETGRRESEGTRKSQAATGGEGYTQMILPHPSSPTSPVHTGAKLPGRGGEGAFGVCLRACVCTKPCVGNEDVEPWRTSGPLVQRLSASTERCINWTQ